MQRSGKADAVQRSKQTVTLVIDREPPVSFNRFLSLHWRRRTYLKEVWRQEVFVAAVRAGRPRFARARVSLRLYYRKEKGVTLPDPDNAQAVAAKLIFDGLVRAGVIPDDSPAYVTFGGPPVVAFDDHPRVEVEIEGEPA